MILPKTSEARRTLDSPRFSTARGLKKLDGLDLLRQQEISVNRVTACDRDPASTDACKRHVRLKRAVVGLAIDLEERRLEGHELIGTFALRPQQSRPSRMRAKANVMERGGESIEFGDC